MKKIVAAVVALLMLATAFTAVAAEKITVFTDQETGAYVTLELESYAIDYDEHSGDEYVQFTLTREGVQPVEVMIAASDAGNKNTNDMTQEELDLFVASLTELLADEGYTVTVETTKDGNKYFRIVGDNEFGAYEERYTIFEGFEMSRVQTSETTFTEDDTDFLAEVQSGLWVSRKGE